MGMITKTRAQVGTPEKTPSPEELAAEEEATPELGAPPTAEQEEKKLSRRERRLSRKKKADAEADAEAASTTDESAEGGDSDGEPAGEKKGPWWKRRQEMKQLEGKFDSYPHLLALKPKESMVFRSDYFEIDGSVGCVLAFFHDDAANDGFAPFWGIDRIPDGLDDSVTTMVFEQVQKMDEKWIETNIKQSERLENLDDTEQAESGTMASRRRAAKISGDREVIIGEIQDGAAYLSVQNRLLVKAPTLEILEDTLSRIERLYVDRFGTLKVAPYAGEQRQELSALFKKNGKKRGKGFHFTSTEFAGSYSLVTNGLNDPTGEYVGYMIGDVNSSAVIFDPNGFEHHVVIADSAVNEYLGREQVSDMWCSKIGQSALLSNSSVVHLVLDGANLDKLGPKFDGLTSRVDLNNGDVNMFEMFGDQKDELSIFAGQMQKLTLMFEQLYESSDGSVASIIRNELEAIATKFYVDQNMWSHNAKDNRDRLRVVGIPHDQVPRLQMFMSYIEMEHKRLMNSSKNDPDQLRALNVLLGVTRNMLSTNGDLFNNITSSAVDGIRDSRRVVYDFSKLRARGGGSGDGVAMAQLVNIVGFAIGKLGLGDTVIVHGTENIDGRVKKYITSQFEQLWARGGRVVFSYNDIDKMLADDEFNKFDAADYTVLGSMRDRTVQKYQEQLHQSIPSDLANLVTRRGESISYLRRGTTNVVFHLDLALGTNPAREKQRREMRLAAARAEEAKKFASLRDDSKLVPGANTTGLGNNGSEPSEKRKNTLQKAKKKRLDKTGGTSVGAKGGTPLVKKQRRGRDGAR